MLTIRFDGSATERYLAELKAKLANPEPLLKGIGEDVAHSTKERFKTSTAPDGTAWAPNSDVTLQRYGSHWGRKIAARRMAQKKPLIGESKALSRTINWQLLPGGKAVAVGTPMIYGAVQQFGADKAPRGREPWGAIPARPFLGLSEADKTHILALVQRHLAPKN